MILSGKIDITKIDKAALFRGQKGTYLDIAIHLRDDGKDQYGNDGMITQDIGRERRQSGERGAILGNVRIVSGSQSAPSNPSKHDDSDLDDIF